MTGDVDGSPAAVHAVRLEGWSPRSVFGWDDRLGCWWAQLRRDPSTARVPEIWIADAGGSVTRLVHLVAERTGLAVEVVDAALADGVQVAASRAVGTGNW